MQWANLRWPIVVGKVFKCSSGGHGSSQIEKYSYFECRKIHTACNAGRIPDTHIRRNSKFALYLFAN